MASPGTHLFAPDVYPKKQTELRAYTVAAFRVAQGSDQLSLAPMSAEVLEFLLKMRALSYWVETGRLTKMASTYHLTPEGLVACQSALADELPSHNTTVEEVEHWTREFTSNTLLPRQMAFKRISAT